MSTEPDLLWAAQQALPTGQLRGLRALIADDNRDGADSLADLLASYGAVAHARYDGGAAITAALALLPNVVILDLTMPGMDGFEACKRIRAVAHRTMLLIALTGRADSATDERSASAGFDMHFIKPVVAGDLVSALAA